MPLTVCDKDSATSIAHTENKSTNTPSDTKEPQFVAEAEIKTQHPQSTLVLPANIFQTSAREKILKVCDGFSKSKIKDIAVYETTTSLRLNSGSILHHHPSYSPVVSRYSS